MDNDRIAKVIFNWEYDLGLNNWCKSVKQILLECGLHQSFETKSLCDIHFIATKLSDEYEMIWREGLYHIRKLMNVICHLIGSNF